MTVEDYGNGVKYYCVDGRLSPGFVASAVAFTGVRVTVVHNHDHVEVFNRGGNAGTLIVNKGDGEILAARLLK